MNEVTHRSVGLPLRALIVNPSPPEGREPEPRPGPGVAGMLRAEGWFVNQVWVPGLPQGLVGACRNLVRPHDLVISFGSRDAAQSAFWTGALVALRGAAPFLVVGGASSRQSGGRNARSDRPSRIISRVLEPSDIGDPDVTAGSLLEDLGLRRARPPRTGTAPLAIKDLGAVIRVHQSAFPDSAMTRLGPRVVERYYRWQFIGDHPAPLALGTWQEGELVGFLFGGVRRDAVSGFAQRFLLTILGGAVTHPFGVRRLAVPKVAAVVRLVFRRWRPASRASRTSHPRPAAGDAGAGVPNSRRRSFGVLSMAVAPQAQGSGAASELMQGAEYRAAELGLSAMHLSVNVANGRAVRFYKKLGWEQAEEGPGWTGSMTKRLGDRPA